MECHFEYACNSWMSNLPSMRMGKLQKSLNKLIRLVVGINCFTNVDDKPFRQLGWLPIERRVAYLKLKIVHIIITNRALVYFNAYFSRVNVKHCYNSRQSLMHLNLCRCTTMYGQRLFEHTVQERYKLPMDIKCLSNSVG